MDVEEFSCLVQFSPQVTEQGTFGWLLQPALTHHVVPGQGLCNVISTLRNTTAIFQHLCNIAGYLGTAKHLTYTTRLLQNTIEILHNATCMLQHYQRVIYPHTKTYNLSGQLSGFSIRFPLARYDTTSVGGTP